MPTDEDADPIRLNGEHRPTMGAKLERSLLMSATRKIGSLTVSVVGLGCNNFGVRLDQARTTQVVDAAIDTGITFFDTADVYGESRSEEYLGRALGSRRSSVVIATKFGLPLDEQRKGARPEYVRQAVEASLKRLGTDYIDLYQLHRPDPLVPIADTLGALDELVKSGKVREIGCSNFTLEQLEQARDASSSAGLAPFVSVQNEYSLLVREPETHVLPYTERSGLTFLPYFPLAGGLLSGKYRSVNDGPEGARLSAPDARLRGRFLNEPNLAIAAAVADYAASRGYSLLDAAFAWLLGNPSVASVIAGATTAEQVRANVAAGQRVLSPEERQRIAQLAPLRPSPPRQTSARISVAGANPL